MSAPRLEYRRRKLILRGGGQPTAGQNEWQVAVPSRAVAVQLGLYMLCLCGLALWRAIELRSTPGIVIELLLYGGIAALLGSVLCVALSQRQGESSSRDVVQMQLLAALGAAGALLLLNSPLSSPEIRLWIALCSLTIAGAACFLHAPWAAGSYAAIVLLGTIVSHVRLGWPGAVLGLAAAAMVIAVARVQAAAFQQSIRKARETEERARTAQAVLRSFEESGSNWLWESDEAGRLAYVSPQFGELLGQDHRSLVGKKLVDLFRPHMGAGDHKSGLPILEFNLAARLVFREVILPVRVDGNQRWLSLSGGPLFDERNQFLGYSGIGADLTDARRSENQARQLALFDTLTGLANRAHFHDTLDDLLERSKKRLSPCVLLFIDLDRFKLVNDTLGHPVGDELLRAVAGRIENVIKDKGRAGRLGGDEFVVVITETANRTAISNLAARLIADLSAPYMVGDSQIIIGASIGIATGPHEGATSDDLLRHADLALYAAKQAGRGAYRFYEASMRTAAETRRSLEMDLRGALASDQLQVVYQPIFDVRQDRLAGFEALLRWNHPARGMVSPEQFIPIAEESGLISQLGEWVLRTACMEAGQWPEHIRIAVNLSPVQFYNTGLSSTVMSALASSQIAPDRVELEITEGVFLQETNATRLTLQQLHEMGVRLALDDFGTGYSSLGYLRKASFSKIKIDRSFIRGIDSPDGENVPIVRAVVALADSLGMITTAEGAETPEEIHALRNIGCTQVQGFAYGKPMSYEAASALVASMESGAGQAILKPRETRVSMFRAARLVADDIEYPAVIRNLSAGGVMAEADAPLNLGMEVRLVIPSFGELDGTIRWIQGARAGILFNEKIEFEAVKSFTRKKKRPGSAEGPSAKPPVPVVQQMAAEQPRRRRKSASR